MCEDTSKVSDKQIGRTLHSAHWNEKQKIGHGETEQSVCARKEETVDSNVLRITIYIVYNLHMAKWVANRSAPARLNKLDYRQVILQLRSH